MHPRAIKKRTHHTNYPPQLLCLAIPSLLRVFALIGTEHDIAVAHALPTAAAACLIMVVPRQLVVFPPPVGAGTALDIGLNGRHLVVLEVGQGARERPIRPLSLLAPGRGRECGFSIGLKVLNPPLSLRTPYNAIIVCVLVARLMALFSRAWAT